MTLMPGNLMLKPDSAEDRVILLARGVVTLDVKDRRCAFVQGKPSQYNHSLTTVQPAESKGQGGLRFGTKGTAIAHTWQLGADERRERTPWLCSLCVRAQRRAPNGAGTHWQPLASGRMGDGAGPRAAQGAGGGGHY